MSTCSQHREFLGAVADGETALVPAATIEHIKDCPDCSREIHAHRLLADRLRAASDHLNGTPAKPLPRPSRRRRVGMIAGIAVAALLIAGGAALSSTLTAPNPVVLAAVQASSGALQIQSTDGSQVSAWCLNASGKSLPAIQLDGMQVVGARMDRVPSADIVTVWYMAPDGSRVTVGWLEGQAPSGSGIEQKNVSGHDLLLVYTQRGTAVILGPSKSARWGAAAAIESTLA